MHRRRASSFWYNPVVMIVGLLLVIAGWFWPYGALLREAYVTRSWQTALFAVALFAFEIAILFVLALLWNRRGRLPRRDQ